MAGRPPPPRYLQLRTATRGEPDRGQGSRTMTAEEDDDTQEGDTPDFDGVLTLRGGPTHGQRVTWQEGTVDNEFLNRKKSKICCIFHKSKPKTFDDPFAESSSSSSSSGDSSDDSNSDEECKQCKKCGTCGDGTTSRGEGDAAPHDTSSIKGKGRGNPDGNDGNGDGEVSHTRDIDPHQHSSDCVHKPHKHKSRRSKPKPNAYEHQPTYGKGKKKRDKGSSTMMIEADKTA